MTKHAEMFMQYNYPETKELCLKFLTIVISILVFSVTFSSKIVDFANAIDALKYIIITSWILLLISIMLCGIGLKIHTEAGGQAVYFANDDQLKRMAARAYKYIVYAGRSFVLSLALLTIVAILSFIKT